MKKVFLIAGFVLLFFGTASADEFYVDAAGGSNAAGDGSQAAPWQTITHALNQITGTGHTLHVAVGTYDTALGETFPIFVKNGVSLVGAGIDMCIVDANNTNSVMRCISIIDTTTRIEGFTLQGGGGVDSGGGLFIATGSALTIAHNKIINNTIG